MSAPTELVVATRNPHKLTEIRAILAGLPVTLLSAADLGAPEVEEDRDTLLGNAVKKAQEVAAATGRLAFADDTGLEVDALGGRPGVYSARFAGPQATYADNCAKLLEEMRGVPREGRAARFRCVIAVAGSGVLPWHVEGRLEGAISLEERGQGGFGYDPLFLVAGDARGRTLAELSPEEKNGLSHRARALAAFRAHLPGLLEQVAALPGNRC